MASRSGLLWLGQRGGSAPWLRASAPWPSDHLGSRSSGQGGDRAGKDHSFVCASRMGTRGDPTGIVGLKNLWSVIGSLLELNFLRKHSYLAIRAQIGALLELL
jgi:hypothetical protein